MYINIKDLDSLYLKKHTVSHYSYSELLIIDRTVKIRYYQDRTVQVSNYVTQLLHQMLFSNTKYVLEI
jgi:hypothetical protein